MQFVKSEHGPYRIHAGAVASPSGQPGFAATLVIKRKSQVGCRARGVPRLCADRRRHLVERARRAAPRGSHSTSSSTNRTGWPSESGQSLHQVVSHRVLRQVRAQIGRRRRVRSNAAHLKFCTGVRYDFVAQARDWELPLERFPLDVVEYSTCWEKVWTPRRKFAGS